MPTVTWLGDGDPSAQVISQSGYRFVKGEPVDVKKDDLAKFNGNPLFSTDSDAKPNAAIEPEPLDPEEGSEKAAIKQLLREAGEDVRGNPSLETLRARLAKLSAGSEG